MTGIGLVVGQVLFSTDELKMKAGIPTKAEWAAQYKVVSMEGPVPPGVPEYDPLLGAGQYNSKALLACMNPRLSALGSVGFVSSYKLLVSLCEKVIRWRIQLLRVCPDACKMMPKGAHDIQKMPLSSRPTHSRVAFFSGFQIRHVVASHRSAKPFSNHACIMCIPDVHVVLCQQFVTCRVAP